MPDPSLTDPSLTDSSLTTPSLLVSADHANRAANNSAVGVFDSGVGGLSVVQHIRRLLPAESILYFADSGFAPYGDKTEAAIIERSLAAADFLVQKKIKALVIACNTATAAAVATLRQRYPELIIVGIEPGLKPAALQSKAKVVGVLATRSTLQSQKFKQLSEQLSAETGVRFISEACTGLADQIEKAELSSDQTMLLVRRYVTPLLAQGADTLVLGCTHYPFVAHLIRQLISATPATTPASAHRDVQLIDTGLAVARRLQRLLEQAHLLNPTINAAAPLLTWTTGSTSNVDYALARILKLPKNECNSQAVV
ncbi:glutamate racemase [soil metagenome]